MAIEILEITDQWGNPTGQTAERSEIHRLGLWHNVTAIWIMNGRENILCSLLGDTKDLDLRGRWSSTIGGHVEPGENVAANAIREAKEELGINIDPRKLQFVCTRQSKTINHVQHVFLWECDLPLTAFKIDGAEITALRWVNKKDYIQEYNQGKFVNTFIKEIKTYLDLT